MMGKKNGQQFEFKGSDSGVYNNSHLWVAIAVSALALTSPLFATHASAASNVAEGNSATQTTTGVKETTNVVPLKTAATQKVSDTVTPQDSSEDPAAKTQLPATDTEANEASQQQSTLAGKDSASQKESPAIAPEETEPEQVNVPVNYQFINLDGKTPVRLENAETGESVPISSILSGTPDDTLMYTAPKLMKAYYADGSSDVYFPIYQNVGFHLFDTGFLIAQYNPEKLTSVLFVYAKLVPLITRTVDEYGRDIETPQEVDHSIGKVTSYAPDIPGYTLVDPSTSQQETDVKFNQPATVIFRYKPNMAVGETDNGPVNVIVNYVDQNGNPIQTSLTSTGNRGDNFSITAPKINGYELVNPDQASITGTYQGNQMVVTLTYRSTANNGGTITGTPTTTPSTPTDNPAVTPDNTTTETSPDQSPTTSESGATTAVESGKTANESTENGTAESKGSAKGVLKAAKSGNSTSQKTSAVTATSLPQTSETQGTGWLAILGMSLLSLFGFGLKRRKN